LPIHVSFPEITQDGYGTAANGKSVVRNVTQQQITPRIAPIRDAFLHFGRFSFIRHKSYQREKPKTDDDTL
jgi:hypothetical protein